MPNSPNAPKSIAAHLCRSSVRDGSRTGVRGRALLTGFVDEIERRMAGTVWTAGRCRSWYLDPRNGRNTTLWPDFSFRFRRRGVDFVERADALNGAGIDLISQGREI